MSLAPLSSPLAPRAPHASMQHRVLIYTTCYNIIDGVTLTIRKIEQEILAQGHCVCIVTTKSGDRSNTHMDGTHPNRTVIFLDNAIPIPFLHDPHSADDCQYQLGFALSAAVKQQISEFEPSLIHITVPDCTCLHLIQYAREKEIPLMGTFHSNIPEYMDHYPGISWLKHVLAAFFRHQYNFLQALYVPTPFIHRHLVATAKMDRITNLGVWGRGIDLERFSPAHRSLEFRRRLGFDDHDVVICWVGRLVPEKRPDIFCKVIRRLHERNIPFRALVIGAGQCEDEVKSLPNTVFAGWMSGDELSVAYASSDVFLFPSGVETFGNVTLEAAASGLPLVVDAGCSGHLVQHGVNGFACFDDDFEAYYDSVLCLVLDDKRRREFSEAGRQYSMNFEKRAVCKKMIENYDRVTDEFYRDYGGHHANRDAAYRKEHSFVAGNHPRPTVIVFVEYLFIVLFRVLYQMASVFLYVQQQMLSPVRGVVGRPTQMVRKKLQTPSNIPTKAMKIIVPEGHELSPASPSARPCSTKASLDSLQRIEEAEECSEISGAADPLETVPLAAELSITEDDVSASTGESLTPNVLAKAAPSESSGKISHYLALKAMDVLTFQSRMESNARNAMGRFFKSSSMRVNPYQKRKISCANVLELQRSRSCDSSSESRARVHLRRPSQSFPAIV